MTVSQLFLDRPSSPAPVWARVATWTVLGVVFSALCWLVLSSAANWGVVWRYRVTFWNGWLMTLGLSAMALVLSTLVGVIAALARRSSVMILRYTASLYIELVRGMPLLVLLLVAFYVVAAAIHVDDRVLVGVVALSLFSGAYIAEMVRAGIESVGRSQLESARAIGLTTAQTYAYVIFPQAFRQTLPPLAGQFASLIKDSSLLMILGISEFTFSAQQAASATFSNLECYLPLAAGYLILTVPISLLSRALEKRFRYET